MLNDRTHIYIFFLTWISNHAACMYIYILSTRRLLNFEIYDFIFKSYVLHNVDVFEILNWVKCFYFILFCNNISYVDL